LEKLESACARNIPKLRELLDLSLDSSREIVLKPKPGDISKTLQQSIQNVQELAETKKVSLTLQNIDSLAITHDALQLERVFTNLIKNAVEAAETHKSNAPQVAISVENALNGATIRIEDTGPGFSESLQIFRPLKTTKVHGYGLGLFVSRKIVEAHRGELTAGMSPTLGGAQFTVLIPNLEANV
jgi:signal transduction histidine kinase